MILAPRRTPEKYRGAVYMDKKLYDTLENLRIMNGFKSWNALVITLLEQALAEIETGGASDDAEK